MLANGTPSLLKSYRDPNQIGAKITARDIKKVSRPADHGRKRRRLNNEAGVVERLSPVASNKKSSIFRSRGQVAQLVEHRTEKAPRTL